MGNNIIHSLNGNYDDYLVKNIFFGRKKDNGTSRQWNIASLDAYISNMENGEPYFEVEELDLYTRYNDFIITRIRTHWGLPLSHLQAEFGDELYRYCLRMARPHIEQGMLQIQENTLRLTRRGIFISDGIMSDLLWVE